MGDAFDRRVLKHEDTDLDGVIDANEPVERYIWDGDEVVLTLDANGNVTHRFLHGPEVDQVFADETAADGVLWYLTDNLHSVRDVVDSTGTVVNHLEYSAFGKITSETDSDATPFFAYTGREWDEAVNLQYNRRRWYDPVIGRWISEDPIRWSAGDPNLYRYVENDPINRVDPSGLDDVPLSQPSRGPLLIPRVPPRAVPPRFVPILRHPEEYTFFNHPISGLPYAVHCKSNHLIPLYAVKSKREWQLMARDIAGLSNGLPHRAANRLRTKAYADLFMRNVDSFYWAGMAALASSTVGKGMDQATQLSYALRQNAFALPADVPDALFDALAAGNAIVFDDIYWQFLAFEEGGISEMRRLANAGDIAPRILLAWEKMHAGDYSGANADILKYEQEIVLQLNVYDKHAGVMMLISGFVESPIPGDGVSFTDVTGPNGNIANFADRWAWIQKSMLPSYMELLTGRLSELIAILKNID